MSDERRPRKKWMSRELDDDEKKRVLDRYHDLLVEFMEARVALKEETIERSWPKVCMDAGVRYRDFVHTTHVDPMFLKEVDAAGSETIEFARGSLENEAMKGSVTHLEFLISKKATEINFSGRLLSAHAQITQNGNGGMMLDGGAGAALSDNAAAAIIKRIGKLVGDPTLLDAVTIKSDEKAGRKRAASITTVSESDCEDVLRRSGTPLVRNVEAAMRDEMDAVLTDG